MIDTDPDSGFPYCTGCGERLPVLPYGLDSRVRGPAFGKDAAARGTSAYDILRFKAQHAGCDQTPQPVAVVSQRGISVIDRGRR